MPSQNPGKRSHHQIPNPGADLAERDEQTIGERCKLPDASTQVVKYAGETGRLPQSRCLETSSEVADLERRMQAALRR